MKDRAMQTLYKLALDPIAETTGDPNSYGFREKRSTADAIAQCFLCLRQRSSATAIWEADIQGCFDHISYECSADEQIQPERIGKAQIFSRRTQQKARRRAVN
jgi:hypothetical protein